MLQVLKEGGIVGGRGADQSVEGRVRRRGRSVGWRSFEGVVGCGRDWGLSGGYEDGAVEVASAAASAALLEAAEVDG